MKCGCGMFRCASETCADEGYWRFPSPLTVENTPVTHGGHTAAGGIGDGTPRRFHMQQEVNMATATVKGGLFESAGLTSLTQVQGTNAGRRRIAQQFSDLGLKGLRALAYALDGVAPGSNATATNARVVASVELGGKRTVETQTLVNRNTAAGDVTEINADLLSSLTSRTTFGANPPANKDGNPLGTR